MVLYHCDSAGERRQFFLGLSLCFVLRRKGVCAMRLVNAAVTGKVKTVKQLTNITGEFVFMHISHEAA
jgi:hypothetical protein